MSRKENGGARASSSIDFYLTNSDVAYGILLISRDQRKFLPGYKIPFKIETNVGELEANVASAPKGTRIGDPVAGNYITGSLGMWYDHNKLDVGDKIRVSKVGNKKYQLKKISRR